MNFKKAEVERSLILTKASLRGCIRFFNANGRFSRKFSFRGIYTMRKCGLIKGKGVPPAIGQRERQNENEIFLI